MEISAYLVFVAVAALQVATPGPSTLFVVRNATAYGRRRALVALSGDLVAIALLATLSATGLGALIVAWPTTFLVLRLAGAAYILWLGWDQLRPAAPQERTRGGADGGRNTSLWLHSFGVGISNPKAVLFFAALFPQFIPGGSGPSVLALLVLTFVAVKLLVLGGYALGARSVGRLLGRPGNARRGRILTGLLFMAFGALMIWAAVADYARPAAGATAAG
ncbi:LysE family translocator [Acuticoccus sediminis]|uniref:LysE family translocator n=1 Tax=Acuticoccus sediminis TaxID=2184697 RepID=A0A8B2NSU1_9HYPH|nr:LysE family translocator [Acuticoccus sediminis]RAI01589.1 LysE family translocator [Acuticoccus sediminis]